MLFVPRGDKNIRQRQVIALLRRDGGHQQQYPADNYAKRISLYSAETGPADHLLSSTKAIQPVVLNNAVIAALVIWLVSADGAVRARIVYAYRSFLLMTYGTARYAYDGTPRDTEQRAAGRPSAKTFQGV